MAATLLLQSTILAIPFKSKGKILKKTTPTVIINNAGVASNIGSNAFSPKIFSENMPFLRTNCHNSKIKKNIKPKSR